MESFILNRTVEDTGIGYGNPILSRKFCQLSMPMILLVYADSGSELNIRGRSRLLEYEQNGPRVRLRDGFRSSLTSKNDSTQKA